MEIVASEEHNPLNIIQDESRRAFFGQCVGALAGITLIGSVGSLMQACSSSATGPEGITGPISVDVSTLDADGKALVTSERGPDGKHVLIVRNAATTFTALSMQCTHERNEVSAPVNGTITCPFHGSKFDLNGNVKTGPATSALKKYQATYDEATKQLTVILA